MSALAMYGCRYFVDEADTFVVRTERRRARTPLQVSSIGLDVSVGIDSASIETVLIDDITPGLRLLTPKLTLVTAVASAFRGGCVVADSAYSWVASGAREGGSSCRRCRGFLDVDPAQALTSEVPLRFRREARRTIASLSDVGADSPPETSLRLLASLVLPTAVTQIQIDEGGQLLTYVDVGDPGLKIALFYEGDQHLWRGQRDRDSRVWAVMQDQGWWVRRVTAGDVLDPRALLGSIRAEVNRRSLGAVYL